jgi:osmotically-inducible protein OsmY
MNRILPILLVLTIAACSTEQKQAGPAMRVLGQPVKPDDARSDSDIGAEIRRRFDADPIAMAAVVIVVDGGHVTLRGSVPNLRSAWRAEAVVRAVPGVNNLTNELVVSGGVR